MSQEKASYWIQHLGLEPHPEGGFFKETYRSALENDFDGFDGKRSASTAIYYLLENQQVSKLHRIKSDELWHFYEGGTLLIIEVKQKGEWITHRLGQNLESGDQLQVLIPAGNWFGAMLENQTGFALAGCTVAPGFDFNDFQMADSKELLSQYPQQQELIEKLT